MLRTSEGRTLRNLPYSLLYTQLGKITSDFIHNVALFFLKHIVPIHLAFFLALYCRDKAKSEAIRGQ